MEKKQIRFRKTCSPKNWRIQGNQYIGSGRQSDVYRACLGKNCNYVGKIIHYRKNNLTDIQNGKDVMFELGERGLSPKLREAILCNDLQALRRIIDSPKKFDEVQQGHEENWKEDLKHHYASVDDKKRAQEMLTSPHYAVFFQDFVKEEKPHKIDDILPAVKNLLDQLFALGFRPYPFKENILPYMEKKTSKWGAKIVGEVDKWSSPLSAEEKKQLLFDSLEEIEKRFHLPPSPLTRFEQTGECKIFEELLNKAASPDCKHLQLTPEWYTKFAKFFRHFLSSEVQKHKNRHCFAGDVVVVCNPKQNWAKVVYLVGSQVWYAKADNCTKSDILVFSVKVVFNEDFINSDDEIALRDQLNTLRERKDTGFHTMGIVIDKTKREAELFEPNGASATWTLAVYDALKNDQRVFKDFVSYNWIPPKIIAREEFKEGTSAPCSLYFGSIFECIVHTFRDKIWKTYSCAVKRILSRICYPDCNVW